MRRLWLCVLATCAACDGVAIGDSGKAEVRRTAPSGPQSAVSDLANLPHGFEHSPNHAVRAADRHMARHARPRAWQRPCRSRSRSRVDEDSIRAVYATDSDDDVRTVAHRQGHARDRRRADPARHGRGRTDARATTRRSARIGSSSRSSRARWQHPSSAREIVSGPALLLDFLYISDGQWHAEWQFAAQVARASRAIETTQMCTGAPGELHPHVPRTRHCRAPAATPSALLSERTWIDNSAFTPCRCAGCSAAARDHGSARLARARRSAEARVRQAQAGSTHTPRPPTMSGGLRLFAQVGYGPQDDTRRWFVRRRARAQGQLHACLGFHPRRPRRHVSRRLAVRRRAQPRRLRRPRARRARQRPAPRLHAVSHGWRRLRQFATQRRPIVCHRIRRPRPRVRRDHLRLAAARRRRARDPAQQHTPGRQLGRRAAAGRVLDDRRAAVDARAAETRRRARRARHANLSPWA